MTSHTVERSPLRDRNPPVFRWLVVLGGLAASACAADEYASNNQQDDLGGTLATASGGASGAGTGGTPARAGAGATVGGAAATGDGAGAGGVGATSGAATAGAGGTGGGATQEGASTGGAGGSSSGAGGGVAGAGGGVAGAGGGVAGDGGGMAGAGGSGGANGGMAGSMGVGGAPGPAEFLPNIRINDNNGRTNMVETSVATGPDGLVLVGWVDARSGLRCGYSSSTDGGATWSENVLIMPEGGGITGDTVVAIDADGTMMAVCQDYSISQIRLMTSTDGGETWSSARSIQGAPDKPWIGTSPTEPGVAFVTWLGPDGAIIKTTDAGLTWDRVEELEGLNHGTTVSVGSSGVVHIVYTPNGGPVRYVRSDDLGESWESARTIGQTGTFCWSNCGSRQHPIIGGGADPSGQYVAVTWAAELPDGEGNEDIWVIYSSDFGDTWTDPIRANDNESSSRQFQPWVAVDSHGRVHAVWTDERNDSQDTYYARMSNPEDGFEENIQVNDGNGGSISGNILDYKGIAIQGSDVMVVFPDTREGSNDIYFAKAPGAAGP